MVRIGGDLEKYKKTRTLYMISIHTSVWEVTPIFLDAVQAEVISIHTSVWEVTLDK